MPLLIEKSREEIKKAKFTAIISLSFAKLDKVPSQLFMNDDIFNKLRRLDLSYNSIKELPIALQQLENLRELWLQSNPITVYPKELCYYKKLEVLDIRNTLIQDLPPDISLLSKLHELDWRDTPFAKNLEIEYNILPNQLDQLMDIKMSSYTRKELDDQLLETLNGEHYKAEADKPNIKSFIKNLVITLSGLFDNLDDYRLFVRRACTLLPEKTDMINNKTLEQTKSKFYQMQRDTTRQRMAADVEIKLRCIYFDRIERKRVIELIDSIYEHVLSLEDIVFFVQYAKEVLPPTAVEANGELIWKNILNLQQDLTNKREGAIAGLATALTALYSEQLPSVINETANKVAKFFQKQRFATKKELIQMAQVSGEVTKLFPPDFISLDPEEVYIAARAMFKAQQ